MTAERPQLALCLRNRDPGWISMNRDGGTWKGTGITSSLEGVVAPMLRQVGINPAHDYTFSCARRAEQVMENLVEEQPTAEALKATLPGYSITILMPIDSPHYPRLWACCWRDPRSGLVANNRFAESTLLEQIEQYFVFYTPARIQTGRAGALELWVRRNWSASELLPDAFPGPKGHPQSFIDAKAAYDAKRAAKRKGKPVKQSEARP